MMIEAGCHAACHVHIIDHWSWIKSLESWAHGNGWRLCPMTHDSNSNEVFHSFSLQVALCQCSLSGFRHGLKFEVWWMAIGNGFSVFKLERTGQWTCDTAVTAQHHVTTTASINICHFLCQLTYAAACLKGAKVNESEPCHSMVQCCQLTQTAEADRD